MLIPGMPLPKTFQKERGLRVLFSSPLGFDIQRHSDHKTPKIDLYLGIINAITDTLTMDV